MEAEEITWLRTQRHLIRIGVSDEGLAFFEFDDYEVCDAMDDYLIEVLNERLGGVWFRRLWDNPTATETHQIIFRDPQIGTSQLQDLLDRI